MLKVQKYRNIIITGASESYSFINGTYEPIEEIYSSCVFYIKRHDAGKCIEYWSQSKCWQIKSTSAQGKDLPLAYLSSISPFPIEIVEGCWRVFVKSDWISQPNIQVIAPASFPIEILGASGPNASAINGKYFPSSNLSNGGTVYHKFDDNEKCIEYSVIKKQWQIQVIKEHSKRCLGVVSSALPVPLESDSHNATWNIQYEDEFQLQSSVSIVTSAFHSVFISGATGTNAELINGVYYPTNESSNGGTLYAKMIGRVIIEYWSVSKQWQVKSLASKGKDSSFAHLSSSSPVPIEMVKGSVWKVTVGSAYHSQPSVQAIVPAEKLFLFKELLDLMLDQLMVSINPVERFLKEHLCTSRLTVLISVLSFQPLYVHGW